MKITIVRVTAGLATAAGLVITGVLPSTVGHRSSPALADRAIRSVTAPYSDGNG